MLSYERELYAINLFNIYVMLQNITRYILFLNYVIVNLVYV